MPYASHYLDFKCKERYADIYTIVQSIVCDRFELFKITPYNYCDMGV